MGNKKIKDIGIKDNQTIQIQNRFFDSSWNLTKRQFRFVMVLLAMTNGQGKTSNLYQAPVALIGKMMGISQKIAYTIIEDFSDELMEAPIYFKWNYDDVTGETSWLKTTWFSKIAYEKTMLIWQLSDPLKTFLLNINSKSGFVSISLKDFISMNNVPAQRFLLLFTKWEKISPITFDISELKHHLGLTAKYKQNSQFCSNVIEKALKEINNKTTFDISVEYIKVGSRFQKIQFTIKRKNKNKFNRVEKSMGILTPEQHKSYEYLLALSNNKIWAQEKANSMTYNDIVDNVILAESVIENLKGTKGEIKNPNSLKIKYVEENRISADKFIRQANDKRKQEVKMAKNQEFEELLQQSEERVKNMENEIVDNNELESDNKGKIFMSFAEWKAHQLE